MSKLRDLMSNLSNIATLAIKNINNTSGSVITTGNNYVNTGVTYTGSSLYGTVMHNDPSIRNITFKAPDNIYKYNIGDIVVCKRPGSEENRIGSISQRDVKIGPVEVVGNKIKEITLWPLYTVSYDKVTLSQTQYEEPELELSFSK